MLDYDISRATDTFRPRYELSSDEIYDLTANLLNERAKDVYEKFRYVAIEVDGRSRYSNIGRHIERVVFEASFGNDTNQMTEEYSPYENSSIFFISIDCTNGKPAGVLRVIKNSQNGLKTINDVRQEPFKVQINDIIQKHNISDMDKVWDIGTVAVHPEYQNGGGSSSVLLYRAMYKSALENGIEHLVSIVDDRALRMLKGHLAIPFVSLADSEPGPYLGSDKSHAVYAFVPEFYEKMSQHMDSVTSRLGKSVLERLVKGSEDESIILVNDYKNHTA